MPYKDPEQRRTQARRWRLNNIEKAREWSRSYYRNNKDAVLTRTAEYQRDNREMSNEASRRWRARNPDKVRARTRAHRQANPELWAAYAKRYREKYPEKARAAIRLGTREYYAKKRGRPAWVDRQELLAV